MKKTSLEKMFFKPDYSHVFLNIPQELQMELYPQRNSNNNLKENYDFILAFYTKKEQLEKEIGEIKNALNDTGLLWIAYPKNKALQTDLTRDILHKLMEQYYFDGVSLISLNDTWSAMRFKKKK